MADKLKWFFETTKNTFSGANDPIHETFRANPYYSIVRESIQNSMDVLLDETKPVVVKFETISINQAEHPELFTLRVHIESCLAFHQGNRQAEDLYGGMLRYLDENPSIKILKVSDYNTTGMQYDSNDHLCPFTSFMGEGISSKSSGAGGSFGFGKGAYYVPSELRTILVSSKLEDSEVVFQGRTRLASHKLDGEINGKDGVFKIDENEPITNQDDIGRIFRRDEQGTDVFILGVGEDPQSGREMVKSVLNNFWLAIHEDRLDVIIKTDDVEVQFDETNLEDIMDEYFPDEVEYGAISDIYDWNPKAYYKAVKYTGQSDDLLLIEGDLSSLGPVRLYIYRKEGLMNRVSFMRKPAMTVYKTGRSILSGYAASFVCDNDKGNEILRQMENAAHNEWKPENVRYGAKDSMQIYQDAKWELNEFIRETLKSISGTDNSNAIEVSGLSDYLTIPEELLDDEEIVSGNADSLNSGASSENKSKNETGLTSTINTKIRAKVMAPDYSNMTISAEEGEGEEVVITGGGTNEEEGGDQPGTGVGDQSGDGAIDDSGAVSTPINVRFRIAVSKDNNEIVHNLILQSDAAYSGVELVLRAGTDNGEESELNIVETDKGNAQGSAISDLDLREGRNLVKVRFDDNIKHTLKLSAYEA